MRLDAVFEEWMSYSLKRNLLPRDINLDLVAKRSHNFIVGMTGLRRSGKSSILMNLAKKLRQDGRHVAYINLEDQRLQGAEDLWDRLLGWFGDEEGYLLLDEVTSAPGWSGFLARAHELYKDHLHLVVTSSRSGLALPPKELRGRIMPLEIFPLTFKEYLRFQGVELDASSIGRSRAGSSLDSYLTWGGLPQVAMEMDEVEKVSILNLIYRNTIAMDVAESARYDLAEIELIGRYLLQSPYFSAGKCLDYLGSVGFKTSKEKLLALEGLMQDSYLFHFPSIFSFGLKDRSQYPRKCHAGDNGFYNLTVSEVGQGRRWENAAFLSVRAELRPGQEVCYWKDRAGREVDLVIRTGMQTQEAIQVCSSLSPGDTWRREISALVRCALELKTTKATILCDQEWTREIDGVSVQAVLMQDWLLREKATSERS